MDGNAVFSLHIRGEHHQVRHNKNAKHQHGVTGKKLRRKSESPRTEDPDSENQGDVCDIAPDDVADDEIRFTVTCRIKTAGEFRQGRSDADKSKPDHQLGNFPDPGNRRCRIHKNIAAFDQKPQAGDENKNIQQQIVTMKFHPSQFSRLIIIRN